MTLAPLILFAASPGTITGVITVAAAHSERALPGTALLAIGVTDRSAAATSAES